MTTNHRKQTEIMITDVVSDLDFCILTSWSLVASSQEDGGNMSFTPRFWGSLTWLMCALNLLRIDNLVING